VALVRTDVSEEPGASFIRVTKIGAPIFVTLMKEAPVPPKRRFLHEPHGVTTQKTPFFIVCLVAAFNTFRSKPLDTETACHNASSKFGLWAGPRYEE
jgi:hypothetical protein